MANHKELLMEFAHEGNSIRIQESSHLTESFISGRASYDGYCLTGCYPKSRKY